MTLFVIAIGFALIYFAIQLQYIWYWFKIPVTPSPQSLLTNVSVLVVARNEGYVIERCLRGILAQQYPTHLFEIIVIDDHSSDDTYQQIQHVADTRIHAFQLIHFPDYIHAPAYKKSAITLGVDKAQHDLIVVTDADCIHPHQWLRTIVHAFESSGSVFQTGPVLLFPGKNELERMQETEMLALMLITGSGIQSGLHDMASGANMIFSKKIFLQVDGYVGNFQFASGDDMFLIEKMRAAFPNQISFAKSKEAVVLTSAQPDWASLLKQRIRWAGKNKGLEKKTISSIWTFVGVYHVLMVVMFFTSLFQITRWYPFLLLLSFKWIADFFLLQQAVFFFKKESLLRHFVPLQVMYSWYIIRMGWGMMRGVKDDWER